MKVYVNWVLVKLVSQLCQYKQQTNLNVFTRSLLGILAYRFSFLVLNFLRSCNFWCATGHFKLININLLANAL